MTRYLTRVPVRVEVTVAQDWSGSPVRRRQHPRLGMEQTIYSSIEKGVESWL